MNHKIVEKEFLIGQSEYDMRCFEGSEDVEGKNSYRLAKNRVAKYKRDLKALKEQDAERKKNKCIECGKEHEHYHIGFFDGVRNYKFCKDCCLKWGTCKAYKDKEAK